MQHGPSEIPQFKKEINQRDNSDKLGQTVASVAACVER